jgi:hypothetical protein
MGEQPTTTRPPIEQMYLANFKEKKSKRTHTEAIARAASYLAGAKRRKMSDATSQRLTVHLPALSLESKSTNWVAGKTNGARDRSENARKSDCLLSGGASSRLDIVTFNNQLEVLMPKKDGSDIQQ